MQYCLTIRVVSDIVDIFQQPVYTRLTSAIIWACNLFLGRWHYLHLTSRNRVVCSFLIECLIDTAVCSCSCPVPTCRYAANKSMDGCAFCNADGDFLIVPQQWSESSHLQSNQSTKIQTYVVASFCTHQPVTCLGSEMSHKFGGGSFRCSEALFSRGHSRTEHKTKRFNLLW